MLTENSTIRRMSSEQNPFNGFFSTAMLLCEAEREREANGKESNSLKPLLCHHIDKSYNVNINR